MNYLFQLITRLLFLLLLLVFYSCGKNIYYDDLEENLVNVNFKFVGFSSQISPLPNYQDNFNKSALSSINSQNELKGYLYFWSFNNDDLLADICYNKDLSPSIAYANGEVPTSFVNSTYAFEDFVSGRAVTFAGAKEIVLKMPIKNVTSLSTLGFDVGSPGTGPKDFEIYYSYNLGFSYEVLSLVNQFETTNTANHKHSYTFDLQSSNINGEELWIKIKPKAGERGSSGSFNESSGILRMDNLYLKGVVSSTTSPDISTDKLHYFLFNKDRSKAVISGVKNLDSDKTLNLSIPVGEYDICFITNDSKEELLLPKDFTIDKFYVGNIFSNYKANIFGYIGELNVNKEKSSQIILERLFSQIKVAFMDSKGLDNVTKIVVSPAQSPFCYAPFNSNFSNPVEDSSVIEFVDDFSVNKQIVFNQFLGKVQVLVPISYHMSIYGVDGIMRTISLSSHLKSNMQLQFRGEILERTDHDNLFSILKNENWNGQEITDF